MTIIIPTHLHVSGRDALLFEAYTEEIKGWVREAAESIGIQPSSLEIAYRKRPGMCDVLRIEAELPECVLVQLQSIVTARRDRQTRAMEVFTLDNSPHEVVAE